MYTNIKFKPETNKENNDVNDINSENNSKDVTKFKKVNIAEWKLILDIFLNV